MRIIGKFRDYYDCMMKTGMDPSTVFVRHPRKLEENPFAILGKMEEFELRTKRLRMNLEPGVLFFCGQLYYFLAYWEHTSPADMKRRHVFTVDAFDKDIGHPGLSFFVEQWLTKGRLFPDYSYCSDMRKLKLHQRWRGNSPSLEMRSQAFVDYALKEGIAYFVLVYGWGSDIVEHHPCLRDLEFQRVVGPPEAFQRIHSYLTNELAREKQMKAEPIPDKMRAANHGFDKWSFRQESIQVRGRSDD